MSERVAVLLVGLDEAEEGTLRRDGSFGVARAAALEDAVEADVLVLALPPGGPLEAMRTARRHAPNAAIIVVTASGDDADGTVAVHAGAEDHLVRDDSLGTLLPRAVRYAVAIRRMRRELETIDTVTALPNLRGFGAIGEHHLRIGDRSGHPVVFVFVRLEEFQDVLASLGPDAADALARDAAAVILQAVRDSDVPARIAPDTFCVLLAGSAEGAEAIVLSRLVESMAEHAAGSDRPRLALAVGSARSTPGSGGSLAVLLDEAARSLSVPGR